MKFKNIFSILIIFIIIIKTSTFEMNFLIEIIKNLNKFYNFKTIVIFQQNDNLKIQNYEELHQNLNNITFIYITSSLPFDKEKDELRFIVNKNFLNLIFYKNNNDKIFNIMYKLLRGYRESKTIFINTNENVSIVNYSIKNFFEIVWQKAIINCILITKNEKNLIEIYNYNPFPKITIQNITNWSIQNYFLNENFHNIKGYPIRTIYNEAYPRSFKYRNIKTGKLQLSGTGGTILIEFVKHLNSSLQEISYKLEKNQSINEKIYELIDKNFIDISSMPLFLFDRFIYGSSYPIMVGKLSIIVPTGNSLLISKYIIYPFQLNLWILLIFTIFYLTIILYISRLVINNIKKIELSESFLHILCIIFNLTLPENINKTIYNQRIRLNYILLNLYGFIIKNLYIALMTSFLSTIIYEKSINTVDDMIKNNLKLLSYQHITNFIIKTGYYPNLIKQIINVTEKECDLGKEKLNRSYAYSATQDKWEFIFKQQKLLKYPLFYVTNINLGTFHLSFPMQFNSIYMKKFKLFLLNVQQSGLYSYWENIAFQQLVQIGKMQIFKDETISNEPKSLELYHFQFIFYAWFIGILLGIICFILEWIKYQLTKNIKKIKKKKGIKMYD